MKGEIFIAFDFGNIFNEISPIAKDVFKSFAGKGATDNVTWLAQTFAGNKHTAKDAASLTEEVYSTIARFNANMRSIEQACAAGKTKEQWLKNFIEATPGLTEQQKGEYLAQANAALTFGNQVMAATMDSPTTIDITAEVNQLMQQDLPPANPNAQWNRYTMVPVVNEISQQAMLMGANGAIIPADISQMPSEEILQGDFTEEERGSVVDEGLKMAAAAAIKIGHAAGKIPFLPKAMPVSVITNIACVGVESFKNIGRVVTGKISPMQAVENIGRGVVSAFANFCTTGIPAKLLTPIPVVGPALSVIVGGILTQCSPEAIQQKIYAGIEKVKPIAKKIANGIKSAVNTVTSTVKNAAKAVVDFFF